MVEEGKEVGIWLGVLKAAMAIPGAKVNRSQFLRTEFLKYYDEELVNIVVEKGIKNTGVDKNVMDKIANGSINFHTATCTATSALTGIPGGLAMIGTIPGDLAQFYFHVVILAQKLAYIYGWPSFDDEDPSDEFLLLLTLFIGIMSGAQGASVAVTKLAKNLAAEVVKRLPRQALTKYGIYQIAKQVAKWLGVNLTKASFAKGVSKAIPFIGAAVSGSVTIATFLPMASKLKKHLQYLPLAETKVD